MVLTSPSPPHIFEPWVIIHKGKKIIFSFCDRASLPNMVHEICSTYNLTDLEMIHIYIFIKSVLFSSEFVLFFPRTCGNDFYRWLFRILCNCNIFYIKNYYDTSVDGTRDLLFRASSFRRHFQSKLEMKLSFVVIRQLFPD